MGNTLYIDRYIETFYYRLTENDQPVSVPDFNSAFALTNFYHSKAPIARDGPCDIEIELKEKSNYSYDSTFYDSLIQVDRYAVMDRIAFFSLMRVMLPSFTLLLDDQTEINVDAFASIYEDGFCSITYIYNGSNIPYTDDFESKIEYWEGIKGIKLNKNLWDILKLKNEDLPQDFSDVAISIEDLFSALGETNKFFHSLLVIKEVLSASKEVEIDLSSIGNGAHVYRYYQFSTGSRITEDIVTHTRQIVEQKEDNYLFPPTMTETLTDITLYRNYKILMNSSYLLCFRKTCEEFYDDILVPFFMMADHCLLQKTKAILALARFKNIEKYGEMSISELLDLKSSLMLTIDQDLTYDFSYIKEEVSAKTIWNCIHTGTYLEELEKVYSRIEQALMTKEQRNRERQQRRFDTRIQIITLFLTIPSVNVIADILYQFDCQTPISFPPPIGITKIILIIASAIISFLVLRDKHDG